MRRAWGIVTFGHGTSMNESFPSFDRRWHLGKTDEELATADFEYALLRCIESFNAWQQECLVAAAGHKMSATDNVVLHITRMNERPKTVTELARLMNRDDLSNIKYSIRKLLDAGLIEKVTESGRRKGTRYRTTADGNALTERFAELRRQQLIPGIGSLAGIRERLQATAGTLNLVGGIYEQAARVIAFHRGPLEEDDGEGGEDDDED